MFRDRLANLLVLLTIFSLPWQTRWIFRDLQMGGESWEYGRLSVYGVEIAIVLAVLLRGKLRIAPALGRFVKPAIFFLGVLLISASFSQNITLALGATQHAVAAAALFALLADERTRLRHAAWAFVLGLVVPCGLAWYQVVAGTSPSASWLGLAAHDAATLGASVVETSTGRVLRGYGTLPHPNVFGGYLAVGLFLCAWLIRGAKRTRGTMLLMAAPVVVLASTLVITFSRGAWLAVAAGFTVLAALMLANRKSPPRHAIPLATLGLFAVLATLVVFHAPAFTRFQPAVRLEAKSISDRAGELPVWDDVVRLNPVTGVGAGNYTLALATLFPGNPIWSYQPIHNAYLLFLAETGLLGLIALFRAARATARSFRPWIPTGNALFAVSMLSAVAILGFFDHYLWSLWPGMVLAAFSLGFALRSRG